MKKLQYDIVIPSWNMAEFAVQCLKSIAKYSSDYRVIFVDNASDQAELDVILPVLEEMPHLLIRNEENLGFVKATNAGIEASEAPYVVFMNNDTEAVSGWLEKLKQPISENKSVVLSGPLTTTPDSWQGRYPKNRKGYVIRTSGMIAFFCTMFRREIFKEIGLLDTQFGIGFGDDDDFCLRVLNAGFTMALVQDLEIPHHHRSTFKKMYDTDKIKNMQVAAINKFKEKHNLQNTIAPAAKAPNKTGFSETVSTLNLVKQDLPVIGKKDAIDVVYVLGTGSKWKNNEIRYSLRSVEKFLYGYRNIYVVGEDPRFLENVIHIKHPDELGPQNADGNIARKVLRMCQEESLSENFLFINDDHILIAPVQVKEIPFFHKGDMSKYNTQHWSSNLWRKRLKRTFDMLKKNGMTTFNFDCHVPMLINKKAFTEAMSMFDYENDIGYTMKSMYGNVVCSTSCTLLTKEKKTIFSPYKIDLIENRLRDCFFMSFNDDGLNAHLKKWLWLKFPDKSKWETGDIEDFYTEVLRWFHGAKDYNEGAVLFGKYVRRHNINKLFLSGETTALREKMEYKLQQILIDYERQ